MGKSWGSACKRWLALYPAAWGCVDCKLRLILRLGPLSIGKMANWAVVVVRNLCFFEVIVPRCNQRDCNVDAQWDQYDSYTNDTQLVIFKGAYLLAPRPDSTWCQRPYCTETHMGAQLGELFKYEADIVAQIFSLSAAMGFAEDQMKWASSKPIAATQLSTKNCGSRWWTLCCLCCQRKRGDDWWSESLYVGQSPYLFSLKEGFWSSRSHWQSSASFVHATGLLSRRVRKYRLRPIIQSRRDSPNHCG